jgi:steroid 5-alpha reductase family enzyme
MIATILFHSQVFALALFSFVCAVFIISQIRKDNSIMDIAYGPAFFVSALFTTIFNVSGSSIASIIILTGIAIWSTRLSIRIGKKNWGKKEDVRYANWRNEWMKKGYFYFFVRSFLQINILQGIIIFFIATPFIISLSTSSYSSYGFLFAGIFVFCFGLLYESIADWQLDSFLTKKRTGIETTPIMTTGLFKFSRRPNYFGETLIWWGFAIICLPLPYGFLALISPILITYIVTKITGPMLERLFLEKYPEEYKKYMQETNYFIPDFSKKSTPHLL